MDNLKQIIAKNIADLRTSAKMTQLELADKLCYSDKAVSKWERGESLPDIIVLKQIADMFDVSINYLLEEEHPVEIAAEKKKKNIRAQAVITLLSVLLVWFIATLVFVVLKIANPSLTGVWISFIYAIPVTCIVWLIFNSIWFNRKRNYIIITFLMWTFLCAFHLTFIIVGFYDMWLVYLLGIPGQIITLIWSHMKK